MDPNSPVDETQSDEDILAGDAEDSEEGDVSEGSDEDQEESDETESDDEEVTDEDEEEKSDDEDDEEEKEEEPVEEELEGSPTRPSIKEIKAEYPEIFKKFPELRHVYFREREFTNLFGTVAEAQTASQKAEVFEKLDESLTAGDPEILVTALESSNALDKFSENILPSLYKKSPEQFERAVQPVLVNLLRTAKAEAAKAGNENLERSVAHICQFLWNKPEIPELNKQNERPDPEKETLKRQLSSVQEEKKQSFHTAIVDTGVAKLLSEIEKRLDPESALPKVMRDSLVRTIHEQVQNQLKADPDHVANMRKLQASAMKAGFAKEFVPRIVTAYLGRARMHLPAIVSKIRKEAALKVTSSEKSGKKVLKADPASTKPTGSSKGTSVNPKKVDYSKTSDLDILNDKVTLKG